MNLTLRPATLADADDCARIIYDAFVGIAREHNFPCDFPGPELAQTLARMCIGNPEFYGVVAEIDGKIVGSNFLDERDAVAGVGPITVDPSCQAKGVGRKLMEAVITRAHKAPSIRLIQEAYNRTSMALYTSLGFDVKEPLVFVNGKLDCALSAGATVKPMTESDLPDCAALCQKVHGIERTNELRADIQQMKPFVLRRGGRIVAYCSAANFYLLNHGVAETVQDMQDLLSGASQAVDVPILSSTLGS